MLPAITLYRLKWDSKRSKCDAIFVMQITNLASAEAWLESALTAVRAARRSAPFRENQ